MWGLTWDSLWGRPLTHTLRSDLHVDDCLRRLQEAIDPEETTIFSLSGYKGSKPVIGTIDGPYFRIHKRRSQRNDFGPVFFGTVASESRGTAMEGYFDMPDWTKTFMKIWLTLTTLLSFPVFILALFQLLAGKSSADDNLWVGLFVFPGFLSMGILLPRFGRLFAAGEEEFLLDFLETAFVARRLPQGTATGTIDDELRA